MQYLNSSQRAKKYGDKYEKLGEKYLLKHFNFVEKVNKEYDFIASPNILIEVKGCKYSPHSNIWNRRYPEFKFPIEQYNLLKELNNKHPVLILFIVNNKRIYYRLIPLLCFKKPIKDRVKMKNLFPYI